MFWRPIFLPFTTKSLNQMSRALFVSCLTEMGFDTSFILNLCELCVKRKQDEIDDYPCTVADYDVKAAGKEAVMRNKRISGRRSVFETENKTVVTASGEFKKAAGEPQVPLTVGRGEVTPKKKNKSQPSPKKAITAEVAEPIAAATPPKSKDKSPPASPKDTDVEMKYSPGNFILNLIYINTYTYNPPFLLPSCLSYSVIHSILFNMVYVALMRLIRSMAKVPESVPNSDQEGDQTGGEEEGEEGGENGEAGENGESESKSEASVNMDSDDENSRSTSNVETDSDTKGHPLMTIDTTGEPDVVQPEEEKPARPIHLFETTTNSFGVGFDEIQLRFTITHGRHPKDTSDFGEFHKSDPFDVVVYATQKNDDLIGKINKLISDVGAMNEQMRALHDRVKYVEGKMDGVTPVAASKILALNPYGIMSANLHSHLAPKPSVAKTEAQAQEAASTGPRVAKTSSSSSSDATKTIWKFWG